MVATLPPHLHPSASPTRFWVVAVYCNMYMLHACKDDTEGGFPSLRKRVTTRQRPCRRAFLPVRRGRETTPSPSLRRGPRITVDPPAPERGAAERGLEIGAVGLALCPKMNVFAEPCISSIAGRFSMYYSRLRREPEGGIGVSNILRWMSFRRVSSREAQ